MSKLPYERVVNVSMTRSDRFPSRRGFSVGLLLSKTSVAGEVDATNRTKYYASMEEVVADWVSTSEPYKYGTVYFAQNPRPIGFKVGYVAIDETPTEAELSAQMDLIYDYDQSWYTIAIEAGMRDQAYLDGLVSWAQAHRKLALIDSNESDLENPADDTNIAARNKGTTDRTAVFYKTTANADYFSAVPMAYISTRDFDQANTRYTMKFKKGLLITPDDLKSSVVTAVTGFVEGVGQSESAGHCANVYVDIGDQDMILEGSTLTQDVFIDEIHSQDWIIARTQEQTLALFLNNASVPFTDQGMQQIASVIRTIMRIAYTAGLIADDVNPLTGLYEPAVIITVPSVFSVPESQRKARISPAIECRFRYAGSIHYTTIKYQMTF